MILSHKLGPGLLTIGAGPLNASAQVTKIVCAPEESVETEPAIPVLSGEELAEEETASYKWKLDVTFLQDDLAAAGLVAYSWAQQGATQPFVFEPNSALDRRITGNLRVVGIAVGGDVKKRNTSDVTFRIIGTPVLVDTP